jgi:MFS family permease
MATDLSAGPGAIELVVAGYALALASGLLISGRLGDIYGARRVFAIGLALFTATSALCGVAPSIDVLVGARIAQGLSAALLMPQVLAILTTSYTGEDRVRAFTAYGLAMGLAAVTGQLIGGLLIAGHLGWEACFLINVPVGIVALPLIPRVVPESQRQAGGRIDLGGAFLATAGLIALVLPLIVGRDHGWPTWTWLSFADAAFLLTAFAFHQRRVARRRGEPLIDPALVREPRFVLGATTTLAFFAGMASFFLVLALYLQQARGLSALGAGLVFTVLAVGYLATSMAAPQIAARLGRHALSAGALTMAAGLLALRLTVGEVGAGGHVAALIPGLAIDGIGMGMVTAPLTQVVLSGIAARYAGIAAGSLSTVQQVANAVGIALIGIVFYASTSTAPASIAHAFGQSLNWLIASSVLVALLARRLTRPA